MSSCCVSGCKNRNSSTSRVKFYRIPSGYRPFQANRRRLWLQALQQVNGIAEDVRGNARICGAHFISGEASMEHDSPDFVPSVFTCTQKSANHKKKVKTGFSCRRKSLRCTANAETEEKSTPPRVDSSVDLQSSVLMEEVQTPSHPLVPKEIKSPTISSPNKALPSFEATAGIPKLDKKIPIVLLKHVFAPAGGYRCEICNQKFTEASQLIKHERLHETEMCKKLVTSQANFTENEWVQEESSFPCNMCDRSFTSSHNLKRHKLLHVKDGRKCPKCGVLFCQRHKHILFLPRSESITESEQESSIIEPQNVGSDLTSANVLLEEPETADPNDDVQSTMSRRPLLTTTAQTVLHTLPKPGPLSKTHEAPPPASYATVLSEVPVPVLLKPFTVPRPPQPVPRYSRNPGTSSQLWPPLPDNLATFVQPCLPQHPELPSSLKMFSPQYLTSTLLEVKRNYEYILSNPRGVKKEKNIVREEQCELPLISPEKQSDERDNKERTAYDLEVVL